MCWKGVPRLDFPRKFNFAHFSTPLCLSTESVRNFTQIGNKMDHFDVLILTFGPSTTRETWHQPSPCRAAGPLLGVQRDWKAKQRSQSSEPTVRLRRLRKLGQYVILLSIRLSHVKMQLFLLYLLCAIWQSLGHDRSHGFIAAYEDIGSSIPDSSDISFLGTDPEESSISSGDQEDIFSDVSENDDTLIGTRCRSIRHISDSH